MADRLQKLTRAEVERMMNLYAMGPLTRRPEDAALDAKGWITKYECEGMDCIEPSNAAYGRVNWDEEATCVLTLANGCVDPIWRDETERFGVWHALVKTFVIWYDSRMSGTWDEACETRMRLVARFPGVVYEVRSFKEATQ